ncbi:hypothetical protein GCM10018785_31950 [Streptomyces longispororuber]|uniref:Lipoprotein n=1 Tax=Streptomyces longispororuber TaxID=68230 RepID=A0A918ZM57_9ACTN|nr:hypothetical protein [Streptomyces longispororuber]GHE60455.1 hypothetical protein GCM10018785_31950 [Streptomyces longispororuber]
MRGRTTGGVAGAGALAVALLSALTGCGALAEREDAAGAAADRFTRSLRAADAGRGCAALAPGTRDELERTAELPCVRALPDAGLPDAGGVRSVDVYGRQARVVLRRDTLFLSSFPDGWKVTAAGCTARPEQPYQCLIKGG